MEEFKILVDGKEFEVKTPLLKGGREIEFSIFYENAFLGTLSPELSENSRISWVLSGPCRSDLIDKKSTQAIGKAIAGHYSKKSY